MTEQRRNSIDEQPQLFGTYEGVEIYILTDADIISTMCRDRKKRVNDYLSLARTKRFVETLAHQTGISGSMLIRKQYRTKTAGGFIYAHRLIALHCAAWLESEFEIWIFEKLEELLVTGKATL
jgi:hypothetical protein